MRIDQWLFWIGHRIMKARGHWVLEVDIRKYFDSIPFAALRECPAKRVTDGVFRKLIDKWLKAGVLKAGQVHYPEAGTLTIQANASQSEAS